MAREFVPGVELARGYYHDIVRPILEARFPGVEHSAALLGTGSEVLGFDTEMSTDHSWGPRLVLFLDEHDIARHRGEMLERLASELPETYRGWATRFPPVDDAPPSQRVQVVVVAEWFEQNLGFDPLDGVSVFDWVSTPTQLLLAATSGEVFHDGLGTLGLRRRALAWYPHDVWLYVIGCQWRRVWQEEPFVGRTGEVGDDLGSRLVAGRVARDLMRLCFLLERRYPPYAKWFGSAFNRLDCAGMVGPRLSRALTATSWQRREAELGAAAEQVGNLHNRLGITKPVESSLRPFYSRPFLVLDSNRFAEAAFEAIADPEVAALPRNVGAIDQWVDSTDVLSALPRPRRAARWLAE